MFFSQKINQKNVITTHKTSIWPYSEYLQEKISINKKLNQLVFYFTLKKQQQNFYTVHLKLNFTFFQKKKYTFKLQHID